jgi:tetratricopeptide (TPR) repeat protein
LAWRETFQAHGELLRLAVAELGLGKYRTTHLILPGADRALRQAAAIATANSFEVIVNEVQWRLGVVRLLEGDLDAAEQLLLAGLAWAEGARITVNQSEIGVVLGVLQRERGDLDGARRCWQTVVDTLPPKHGVAESLCHLGLLLSDEGRVAEAEAHYLRALELARALGFRHLAARSLAGLGLIAVDDERAAERFAEAQAEIDALEGSVVPSLDLALARCERQPTPELLQQIEAVTSLRAPGLHAARRARLRERLAR